MASERLSPLIGGRVPIVPDRVPVALRIRKHFTCSATQLTPIRARVSIRAVRTVSPKHASAYAPSSEWYDVVDVMDPGDRGLRDPDRSRSGSATPRAAC